MVVQSLNVEWSCNAEESLPIYAVMSFHPPSPLKLLSLRFVHFSETISGRVVRSCASMFAETPQM